MKKAFAIIMSIFVFVLGASAVKAQTTTEYYYGEPGMPQIFIKIVNLMRGSSEQAVTPVRNSNTTTNSNNRNNNSAELRLTTNRLLVEHSTLAITDMQLIYTNKDATRTRQLLNNNTQQLANVLGSTFQTNNQQTPNGALSFNRNEFINLWNQHINEYENYARALREGNTQNQQNARNNLQNISRQIALQFDTVGETPATQNVDADDQIWRVMSNHVNGTITTFDTYALNNSTEYSNNLVIGIQHANEFADTITRVYETTVIGPTRAPTPRP